MTKKLTYPFPWLSAFMVLFILIALASPAQAWWNDQWMYRKKIILDTSSSGIDLKENLGQPTVLLRLHSGNLDFTRVKEKGRDLRFVSSDDKTLLKYHFEKYDTLYEMALIWVKVTSLADASGSNFIWMYYGNEAAEDGQDAKGTYDLNQAAVYHLEESEGLFKDQTAYDNNISDSGGGSLGMPVPAIIGSGLSLNGISDRMIIPASPPLNFPGTSGGFTFSTWLRIAGPQKDAYLFAREEQSGSLVIGINQEKVYCRIAKDKDQAAVAEADTDLSAGRWYHVAVSVDQSGKLDIYLDGTSVCTRDLPAALPDLTGTCALGASTAGGHFLLGELDEIQISNLARPGAWIRLAATGQGPESSLVAYAGEERNVEESGLKRALSNYWAYTRTVIRYTTLDGWVINIILVIMLALSWIVLLAKTLTLFLADKGNKEFLEVFRESSDMLAFENTDKNFQDSPLHQIYCEGKQELKGRIGSAGGSKSQEGILKSKEITSFKASLEKGTTKEEQRLNKWLLILTLAISGGPFLGLLGTVWGIMNTFAGMAMAGEADIVVIAPGIASALSTTVIGLIVAIPALFGYNYLVGKIRNLTADMYLFVDEFICKVEEKYGERA
ncbi:MAG: DUF2341 domain-containing protein [bacterium]